jgi:4-amino-4-deoxy-L-arabinose transferase-like glycosyltransferase
MNILVHRNWFETALLPIALFLFLVGPFALQYHLHYPDEMYYTDGAVIMQQGDDYLTPYLGNGEMRFKKPILTYWFVLAGQLIWGVSPFASRFFFWLAGGLVVLLTYHVAKTIAGSHKLALLSAFIAAAHPTVMISATRSIPDILLCAFTTFSALGVAGFIRYGNDAPRRYLWYFYLGTALAFETKGLPALALGGIAWLFLLVNPWQRIRIAKLLRFWPILVSAAIALSWFVSMYLIHGSSYLDSFFNDQVGIRVTSKALLIPRNLALAVLLTVGLFIPWPLFAVKKFKTNFKNIGNSQSPVAAFQWFAVVWVISIIAMSAMVSAFYERYLLPVIPVAAVWLSMFLEKNEWEKKRMAKVVAYVMVAINLVALAGCVFFMSGIKTSVWQWLQLALSVGFVSVAFYFIKKEKHLMATLGTTIMLLMFEISIASGLVSFPGPEKQVPEFLSKDHFNASNQIGFIGDIHNSAQMRMGLGTRYSLTNIETEITPETIDSYDYFIVGQDSVEIFQRSYFSVQPMSQVWNVIPAGELFKSVAAHRYREFKQEYGYTYYWVEKR